MCNDFGNRISYDNYVEAFSQTRLPLKMPAAIPNLKPQDDIWPTVVFEVAGLKMLMRICDSRQEPLASIGAAS